MKNLLLGILLFFPTHLFSQTLREFDLQEMTEQQIPVFIEHFNEATLLFYTAINGFTIESNTGGIVNIQSEASKVTVFLKPERQILTLKAPGFIEKKLSIENLSAKQTKFYRLNAKEENYSGEKGSLLVNSLPEGALLKIDGFPTFKQLTPFDLKDFKAGTYQINLTKPGYYPLDTLIEIRQGMKQSRLFEMRSMYGTLSIRTVLPVEVKLGDRTINAGPNLSNLSLREGYYELGVNDSRFDLYSETIRVESGKTKILDLPLVKRSGFLQIMHPDEFDFTVNGETQTKRPGTHLVEFFEGSYKADIKRPGFRQVAFLFTIKKGEVVNWEPVFKAVTVTVNLKTEPAGATVHLNRGQEQEVLGFTPLEEQIPAGEIEFTVTKEGFKDYRFKVKLKEGNPFQRTINLANPSSGEPGIIKRISYSTLAYNGFIYKTVIIGNQEWTVENLRTKTYNDRTPIRSITDYTEWTKTTTGAFCVYDNWEGNVSTYGYLYNWYAVNTGKLAPATGGWRVPTDEDWTKLTDYVGGESTAGSVLKASSGWDDNGNGTNEYGFSALPGGYRIDFSGAFIDFGQGGGWWSSSASDATKALRWFIYYQSNRLVRDGTNQRLGFSVRLVRDL
ncbi:MAG: PEGA domain-containing protein [Bacteroidetes bacterium]|nr:PEGA domain-containing protein [Bacteroidota bacterium]